jgi:hypothetical protein
MIYLLDAVDCTHCEQQKSHDTLILYLPQVTVSVRMTRSSDQVKAVNEQALEQRVLSIVEP